jgi:bifunctional DNA-binding transcriptional regulator/antitoxin component of YhaV-PrlF toxin-antitoxin module
MPQIESRNVQGVVGEQSFSVVLPKSYAIHLGIGKGDFVKVSQEENKIVIEKAYGDKNDN